MELDKHDTKNIDPTTLPTFVWLALTNKCNLKCSHCQRELLKKQGLIKPQEMPDVLFDKIEAQLFQHLERIQFGGNNFGEQLLASLWDCVFERVVKYKINISIVTNCTLMTRQRIKKMVDEGVEFNFSLEGINESYEAVRGFKFEKFFETVREVCLVRAQTPSSKTRINLGFTLDSDNIGELLTLMKKFASIGVDRITITHFVPWREDQRHKSLVYDKERSNRILSEARTLAHDLKLIVDVPMPFEIDDVASGNKNENNAFVRKNKSCYHPWQSASINERGDVMPCCATSVVMGNLQTETFEDIWNGSRYQKLRNTVNSDKPLRFCRNCSLRGIVVGSDESLSFCSDESQLLAAIDIEGQSINAINVLKRVKNLLGQTKLGRKLLPYLVAHYRRHAAFKD